MKPFQLAAAALLVAGFANAATISEADCSAAKLGSGIRASAIGESVSAVTQEVAAPDASMHAHLGVLGVTGFLMRDPAANPLDYVEGGPLSARRQQLSEWLDSTNPDLTKFANRGGKRSSPSERMTRWLHRAPNSITTSRS